MILFVDDMQTRYDAFVARYADYVIEFAQDITTAREMLLANNYDQVFLDHDMTEEDLANLQGFGCGQQLAVWMVANKELLNDPLIVIHSHNPDGAKAMYYILKEHFTDVTVTPFSWLI